MNEKLYAFINEGEHQQQDFKFCISDSKKIARSLVAFANTDGGRLLVGVKDNGKIAGVRSEEEFHMIEAAANLYSKPSVNFEFNTWKIEGKIILEINISPSDQRPHFALNEKEEWKPYVRVHDENRMGNKILAAVWVQEKSNKSDSILFSSSEIELLKSLRNREYFSFNQFKRMSKLHYKRAEKLIIKLICWDIIDLEFTQQGCKYFLSPEKDISQIISNHKQ